MEQAELFTSASAPKSPGNAGLRCGWRASGPGGGPLPRLHGPRVLGTRPWDPQVEGADHAFRYLRIQDPGLQLPPHDVPSCLWWGAGVPRACGHHPTKGLGSEERSPQHAQMDALPPVYSDVPQIGTQYLHMSGGFWKPAVGHHSAIPPGRV